MNVREIALKLLLDYELDGKYINLSLSSHATDGLCEEEMKQLTHLLYTTVEHKLTYDYYISYITKRSIDKLSLHTKNILRLGLCQILDTDTMPDFAAVNETVKLAKNRGERALVNAALRTAAREKDSLPLPDKSKNPARYSSIKYSLPIATVRHFFSELSEEEATCLFDSFGKERDTTVTVNTARVSVEKYLEMLIDGGYNATRATFSPISVRIFGSVNPRSLPGFSEGLFFVQDEASALSAITLGALDGETVVDVCAAPGGKSFAVATLTKNASVYSFDIHESKLSLIEGGAKRLGLTSVRARAVDARVGDPSLFGKADRVLCDAPCSGLGVIDKKPDLRYKDISALSELPALQLEILSAASKYVKSGGTLVYSTCTVNRAENEEVVSAFLSANPDFHPEDFSYGELKSEGGALRLYPHIHKTDGFFITKLRRQND